jgi:hypothetical protein
LAAETSREANLVAVQTTMAARWSLVMNEEQWRIETVFLIAKERIQ